MIVPANEHKGKTAYVGIDVHKRTYTISAWAEDMTKPVKKGNLPADPDALVRRLYMMFPGALIRTVYEAGFAGFVLHRVLEKAGIRNIVVHPASIEVAANSRVKTDKIDASKLAEHLSMKRLVGIDIPSEQQELDRTLVRTREQLVEDRKRIGNQIKSRLTQFGKLSMDDDRRMSDKLVDEFLDLDLAPELKVALQSLGRCYKQVSSEIKSIEAELARQAAADSKEEILRSVPGIGKISARTLAVELGDVRRFPNQKALSSFLGLTPSEYSSGETERKGRITKQGRGKLRSLLVECSWRAIASDEYLTHTYDQLKGRIGGKRAVVAVARRLAGIVRSCLLAGQPYELLAHKGVR